MADTMAAIAEAESTGHPYALNDTRAANIPEQNKDYSFGLWQINYYGQNYAPRVRAYGPPYYMFNPIDNARAAASLAKNDGSGLGNWTTYRNQDYRKYLTGKDYSGAKTGSFSSSTKGLYQDNGQLNVTADFAKQEGIPTPFNPNGKKYVPGSGIVSGSADTPVGAAKAVLGKGIGKDIQYGLIIGGGGLLVLLGLLLVGADLGIAAFASVRNRTANSPLGTLASARQERQAESISQAERARTSAETQAARQQALAAQESRRESIAAARVKTEQARATKIRSATRSARETHKDRSMYKASQKKRKVLVVNQPKRRVIAAAPDTSIPF